ncbi:MAG: hypothetical protein E7A26_19620 [Clostridioides difficile]|nr:hypothetical protein [Clostridioides difficile]
MFLVGQLCCMIAYYFISKGLEKPAGIIEVVKFCFNSPSDYFLSIAVGVMAWVLSAITLLSIIFEFPIIKDLIEDDYSYYSRRTSFEKIDKPKYIINISLCLILLVGNFILLRFLMILIFVLLGATAIVGFLASSSNN